MGWWDQARLADRRLSIRLTVLGSVVACMNMIYGVAWDCVGNNNYKEVTLRLLRQRCDTVKQGAN